MAKLKPEAIVPCIKLESLWPLLAKLKESKDPTLVQTGSLTIEVGWRLRQIATQMGVSPGQLIEVLIAPTVRGPRLPWETIGRVSMGLTPITESGVETQESDGEGAGETLPIGETLTSSDQQSLMPESGAGEGGEKPPAPAAPTVGGKARPVQPAAKRKAG